MGWRGQVLWYYDYGCEEVDWAIWVKDGREKKGGGA